MKIYRYLYKLKPYQLVLIGTLLVLAFNYTISIYYEWLGLEDNTITEEDRVSILTIIDATIISPLLETLIFQYLPLIIVYYHFKKYKYRYCIVIVLSAIAFAAVHPHELPYFTYILFLGLTLSFSCFIFIRKKRYPILYTSLIHAGYNSFLLIGRMFLLDFDLIK
ncbi:MAG: CPBP family intramembrane metalloprotease [Dysgonamonadaceae bacterium]|jgi:hypothetical protein|nr:CPBP family intramembrane metalloprotease [Dysgonamonadaceae bacterium]